MGRLNTDCLVNIFLRVDMENMLLDVPYVCKSWYKVTCTPQCWTALNFTNIWKDERDCHESNSSAVTSFIKHVVKRSNGLATFVELPTYCNQDAIIFISNECPNLKTLLLPVDGPDFPTWQFSSLVSKWKRLEKLRLCSSFDIREIIVQIGLHCNEFEALEICDFRHGEIGEEEASALCAFLPNLKVLSLKYASISKEDLLVILNCCKKLEVLDARHCLGFHEGDDDILKSAAHITRVSFEGSRLNDDYYDEYEYYNYYCDVCCGCHTRKMGCWNYSDDSDEFL